MAVDNNPPVTQADTPAGASRETVVVSFAASDDASGVGGTFVRVVAQGESAGDFEPGNEAEVAASEDHSLDGTYTVQYYSVDRVGNTEKVREVKVRIDTSVAVKLGNSAQDASGERLYPVEGKCEPGSTVTVNGARVTVAADGSFFEQVELNPGSNQVVIVVTDSAGNSITKRISVTYNQPLSQTSWILPLVVAVIVAAAVAVLVLRRKKRMRAAAMEEPPQDWQ
jgi:hypothetical protein